MIAVPIYAMPGAPAISNHAKLRFFVSPDRMVVGTRGRICDDCKPSGFGTRLSPEGPWQRNTFKRRERGESARWDSSAFHR